MCAICQVYLWDFGRRKTTIIAVATRAITARSCVAKAISVSFIIGDKLDFGQFRQKAYEIRGLARARPLQLSS